MTARPGIYGGSAGWACMVHYTCSSTSIHARLATAMEFERHPPDCLTRHLRHRGLGLVWSGLPASCCQHCPSRRQRWWQTPQRPPVEGTPLSSLPPWRGDCACVIVGSLGYRCCRRGWVGWRRVSGRVQAHIGVAVVDSMQGERARKGRG
jgi:hypothetical protein